MKSKSFSKLYFVLPVAVLCCALWGSAFPMIKLGYSAFNIPSADTGSIILFAGVRFFVAGVLTIAIFSVVERKLLLPTRSALPRITVLSLFQTIFQYIFFYLGLAFTTGQKASIINGSSCVFALFVACLVFKTERFTRQKLLASLLCFVGVVLSGLDFASPQGFSFVIGDLFILGSALSYSFSSALLRQYSQHYSPYMLSGYQFMLGGAVMIAVGLLMHGSIDVYNIKGISIMLYLAFASAIAYSLWGLLLKYNQVSRIAVLGAMTPVFGFFMSLVLLKGDSTNLVTNLIALVFIVIGIICINYNNKSKT